MIVAVDLGYGWTKALARQRSFLEPSVVGPAEQLLEGLGGASGVTLWEGSQGYFVGSHAVKQCQFPWHNLADHKPADPNTWRLLKAALAMVAPVPSGIFHIDLLITGLPVNLWATQREELERRIAALNGTTVKVDHGAQRTFIGLRLGSMKVLAQPYGSLLDHILDDDGHLVRQDLATGRVLVVDIGFHTVDLLAVEGLEPVTRLSAGTNFGLATAYAAVARKLNRPLWEIDRQAVAGRLTGADEPLRHLAANISQTIESLNGDFDHFLITGGGGKVLYGDLAVPGPKLLTPDPQLANVRGYLKAGQRLRRRMGASA